MSDKPQMLSLCLLFLGWLVYLFAENLELLGRAVLRNSLNSRPAQAPERYSLCSFRLHPGAWMGVQESQKGDQVAAVGNGAQELNTGWRVDSRRIEVLL